MIPCAVLRVSQLSKLYKRLLTVKLKVIFILFEYKQSSVSYWEAEILAKQYAVLDFKNRVSIYI